MIILKKLIRKVDWLKLKDKNMTKVKINIFKKGPALVEGEVELSKNGEIIKTEDKFYLCRCGRSKKQPFCDGSHKSCGFED